MASRARCHSGSKSSIDAVHPSIRTTTRRTPVRRARATEAKRGTAQAGTPPAILEVGTGGRCAPVPELTHRRSHHETSRQRFHLRHAVDGSRRLGLNANDGAGMLMLFANVLTFRATRLQSSARAHIGCEWRRRPGRAWEPRAVWQTVVFRTEMLPRNWNRHVAPGPTITVDVRNPVKVITRSTDKVITDSRVSDHVPERSDAGVGL